MFTNERQSMVCPPARRDNPRALALARGLSIVQADEPCSVSHVALYPALYLACNGVSRAKDLGMWRLCYTYNALVTYTAMQFFSRVATDKNQNLLK